jgi:hypothetical protein
MLCKRYRHNACYVLKPGGLIILAARVQTQRRRAYRAEHPHAEEPAALGMEWSEEALDDADLWGIEDPLGFPNNIPR